MADTTAEWNLSIDTQCPHCNHNFDLRCELVDNVSSIQICETDTVAREIMRRRVQNADMNSQLILCTED